MTRRAGRRAECLAERLAKRLVHSQINCRGNTGQRPMPVGWQGPSAATARIRPQLTRPACAAMAGHPELSPGGWRA